MFACFFPPLDRLRAFERQRQYLIIVFLWSQWNVDPTHSPPGIPCPFSLPADFVTTGPAIEWNLYFWILQQLPSLNCTNWNGAYASLSLATFFSCISQKFFLPSKEWLCQYVNLPRVYVSSLVPESLGRTQNITHDPSRREKSAPGWGWCLVPESSRIECSNGFLEVITNALARKTKVLAGPLMIANLEVNGSSRMYHYLASPFNS